MEYFKEMVKYKNWYIRKENDSKFYDLAKSELGFGEYGFFLTIEEAKEFIDML